MNERQGSTVSTVAVDPGTAQRLKNCAAKIDDWTEERDALIRQAIASGASTREVAELVGLSHTWVRQIASR